jgi:hypothetical protein
VYSNGRSEEIIGNTLRTCGIPRRKVVIMTKVGRVMADEGPQGPGIPFMNREAASSKDYVNQYGAKSMTFKSIRRKKGIPALLIMINWSIKVSLGNRYSGQSMNPYVDCKPTTSTFCRSTVSIPTSHPRKPCELYMTW